MFITRRKFLQGCSASIAALAGARLTNLAYAADDTNGDTLVVVSLRGGWDALNVVSPISGDDRKLYEEARPGIKISAKKLLPLNDQFGLHPAMKPLHELYKAGQMGIVTAVGLDYDTRSHFDAIEFIELGTPGNKATTSGWITRFLQTAPLNMMSLIPVVSAPSQPTALLDNTTVVSMNRIGDLSQWDNGHLVEQQKALEQLYVGDGLLQAVGRRTLAAVRSIAPHIEEDYTPQNGAVYADDELGQQLKTIARLIKMDSGIKVATVDFGGWDTHEWENDDEKGYLGDQLRSLAQGIANFYLDLDNGYTKRMSIIVMSEFGRRLAQNDSGGTDHGHGSVLLALGGSVNGGQVFGRWPGLQPDQLYDRADLAITTDYRAVLSEMLLKRQSDPNITNIFPGYSGLTDLGLFKEG